MIPVRQSTAFETSIGPVFDADGVAFTGAVVGDFQVKKTSGDWAALNASATATHTAVGNYDLVLTADDLDTVGVVAIRINDTVNACATLYLQVIEEAVYDAIYAASANAFQGAAGSTKVTGVVLVDTLTTYTGNTPQTADHTASIAAILADTGTDGVVVNAAGLATDAVEEIRNAITGYAGSLSTDASGMIRVVDGTLTGELDTLSGTVLLRAATQASIDAIEGDTTTDIPALIAALNNLSAAQVNAEVDAAIETYHLDHLLAVEYDPASKPGVATALLNELIESDAGVSRFTVNSLENAPSGSGASAEAIADEVQTRTIAGVTLVATTTNLTNLPTIPTNWLTADGLAADAVTEIRNAITGGAYALNTSATGSVRVVDGTGTDEVDLLSGTVLLRAATQASIDAIEGDLEDGGRLDLLIDTIKASTDYPDGYVYLDSTNGASGTTVGTNGTLRNPSDTFANAATIAASLGPKKIRLIGGGGTVSTGTFSGYVVDLNGKSIVFNQNVSFDTSSRVFSSSGPGFISPNLGAFQDTNDLDTGTWFENVSFSNSLRATNYCYLKNCIIGTAGVPLTFTIQGDNGTDPVYLEDCYTAKISGLTFDCSGGADLIMAGWYGDFTITNLAAGTTVQVYGWGKVTLDASCTGGTIRYTSHVEITDNASGAVTQDLVSEATPWNPDWDAEVQSEVTDAFNAYDPPTNTEMLAAFTTTDGLITTVDTVVDGIQSDLSNATDGLGALKALIDALPSQADITGGAYALDTDANGRIRSVDGIGVGEFDTLSGTVLLRAATQASIDAIDAIKAKTDQMTYTVANKLDSNPTPTAAICNKIADHIRRRTQANVEASSDGDTLNLSSLYGFIQTAQNSGPVAAGVLPVRNPGGTLLGNLEPTSDADALPTIGMGIA